MIRVGQIQYDWDLIKRENWGTKADIHLRGNYMKRHTEKTMWRQGIGVMPWLAMECQRLATQHQKMVRHRKDSPIGFRESIALLTPQFQDSSLQNYWTIIISCSNPSCWHFVKSALGNSYTFHFKAKVLNVTNFL